MMEREKQQELERLRAKLAASERIGGRAYVERIEAIKARMEEVEAS